MKKDFLLFFIGFAAEALMLASVPQALKLTPQQIETQRRIGSLTIFSLKQQITNYKDAIQAIINNLPGMTETNKKIDELNKKITQEKQTLGIAALETKINNLIDQIDQAAVEVYAIAIDPNDLINLFRKINDVVLDIQSDVFTKMKMDEINVLKQKIDQRIRPQIDEIQELGRQISQLAKPEVQQANQLAMQLFNQEVQVTNAIQKVIEKIAPLEDDIIKNKNVITANLNKVDEYELDKLTHYKKEIKKLKLILKYINNPNEAATTTEDDVALFEG